MVPLHCLLEGAGEQAHVGQVERLDLTRHGRRDHVPRHRGHGRLRRRGSVRGSGVGGGRHLTQSGGDRPRAERLQEPAARQAGSGFFFHVQYPLDICYTQYSDGLNGRP